jgi:hypothetical protein
MRIRIVVLALCAGLLLAIGLPLALGASGERTKTLATPMNGKREVDANGRKNAGDLNGLGGFTAVIDNGRLCFGITVRGLDTPVAAHIHRGGPNVMGPIVLPLTQPSTGDPGASSGCVDIQESLANQLLRRPTRFYVNVHTGPFPNGAVRGQLKTEK